jgi:hypothetical protein
MPWLEIVDESTGRPYYYNDETQETSWTLPTPASKPAENRVDFGVPPPRIMQLLVKNLSKSSRLFT